MEHITPAALGPEMDSSNDKYYNLWHGFLHEMVTVSADTTDLYKKSLHKKYGAALNERKDIASEIFWVALVSHVVDNAFYHVNMGDNPHVVCLVLLQPIQYMLLRKV
jgi:hypothetical protein